MKYLYIYIYIYTYIYIYILVYITGRAGLHGTVARIVVEIDDVGATYNCATSMDVS